MVELLLDKEVLALWLFVSLYSNIIKLQMISRSSVSQIINSYSQFASYSLQKDFLSKWRVWLFDFIYHCISRSCRKQVSYHR